MRFILATLLFLSVLSLTAQESNPALSSRSAAQSAPIAVLQMNKSSFEQKGGEECATLTLTNRGDTLLVIESLQWSQNRGYRFTPEVALPLTLLPGEEKMLQVCNDASGGMLPLDTLHVRSNSRKPTAWGLLLDVSRSMILDKIPCGTREITRLEGAKSFLADFIDNVLIDAADIGVQDWTEIITFSSLRNSANNIIEPYISMTYPFGPFTEDQGNEMKERIDTLSPIGGSHTGAALDSTISSFTQSPAIIRRILLITDGETDDVGLYSATYLARQVKQAGIEIYAVDMSSTYPEVRRYLDTLATGTGGEFFSARSCDDLDTLVQSVNTASRRSQYHEPFPMGQTLAVEEEGGSTISNPAGQREARSITILNVADHLSSQQIYVDLQAHRGTTVHLSLYDNDGQQIQQTDPYLLSQGEERRIVLDAKQIPSGVYLIGVQSEEGEVAAAKVFVGVQ